MRLPHRTSSTAAVLVAASLTMAACDTVTDTEPFELTAEAAYTFRFTVPSGGLPGPVDAEAAVDLGPELSGFGKGEVLSASVTRVQLTRVQPVGQTLGDLLTAAELQLTGAGSGARAVARASAFPATSRTTLEVLPGVDVGALVRAPAVGARLDPEGLPPGNYVFEADVDFLVNVEAL